MKSIFNVLTIISLLGLGFLSLADNNDETLPINIGDQNLSITNNNITVLPDPEMILDQ